MKTLSTIMAVTALALGSAGGVLAYTTTSSGAPQASQQVTSATPKAVSPVTKPAAQIRTRFRPCKAGARLEHGKCVRHVVRTVVVPAPPAPVAVVVPATRTGSEDHAGTSGRQTTQTREAHPRADQVSRDEVSQDPEHGKDPEHGVEQEHDPEQEHGEDPEVQGDD